jgi:hypothetical protein
MRKAPNPTYSPDLTRYDFYLFGDMKRKQSGCMFKSRDEILSAIQIISDQFEKSILIAVSHEWIRKHPILQ